MTPFAITILTPFLMAACLLWIGRLPICECGYIKFWHGVALSGENSQHLSDWYTPSHVLHGLIFYGAIWLVARRLDVGWRLAIATIIEGAWEVLENTDAVIERYREVTISLDYFGDSVVNSATDVVAMWVGFWLASRLPVWASVAIFFFLELLMLWAIRDGLTLNVLMFLYPIDAIREFQSAS